ncbi:MAG: hypothetical protein Q8Q62_02470, partial [Mesorhizobium sp.]|nr:hypothetical protein [Mesorhizobium sp.]
IAGQASSLWSPEFYYPFRDALAFSDNHLGSAPVYVLFRLAGLGPEHAFAGWHLVGCAATFAACVAAMRMLGFGVLASGVAAFVFAFGIPVLEQVYHAQLTYRFATPLAFACFWRAFERNEPGQFARAGFWTVWQFYCSIYLGMFLLLLLAATALAWFILADRPARRLFLRSLSRMRPRDAVHLSAAFAVLGLAFAALLLPYLLVAREYGFGRSYAEIDTMLPRLSSYLLADDQPYGAWLSGWIENIPMRHEHQLFVGFAPLALFLAGTFAIIRHGTRLPVARPSLLALLMLFLLTLHVGGWSLYALVAHLPGFNAVRAVSRVILVMLLPISIVAATGVEALGNVLRVRSAASSLAFGAALAALLVPELALQPAAFSPISEMQARLDRLMPHLPQPLPADAILSVAAVPGADHGAAIEVDAMMLAQRLGIPTINGYSGNAPPGVSIVTPCGDAIFRLSGYAVHAGLSPEDLGRLAARVVMVRLAPCDQKPDVPGFAGPLGPDVPAGIALRVESLRENDAGAIAVVEIANNGRSRFDTISLSAQQVRLAWRFVDARGRPVLLGGDWGSRLELFQSIEPGGTASVPLHLPAPPAGASRLEVAMLLEHVMWFHEHGMRVAAFDLPAKREIPN